MKNWFINTLKSCFSSTSGQRFLEKLHLLILYLQNYGLSGECDSSGEIRVLQKLAEDLNKKQNLVVFDVGANIGKYAINFAKLLRTSYVMHCFEPSAKTLITLRENTKTNPNIVLHNMGLGNEELETVLYSNEVTNTQSSLLQRDMSHWGDNYNLRNEEKVVITTLDHFCSNHQIEYIDFLKLDVEGFEWNCLTGAQGMLRRKKIGILQFELGVGAVDGKYFFKDIFYLLRDNYRIYRITKNNLYEIKRYKEQYEVFLTSNYIAILK